MPTTSRTRTTGTRPPAAPLIGNAERIALTRYFRGRWPGIEAEDIVQEVALALWTGRDRYDPERPLMPYLLTIARRRVMDRMRLHYRAAGRRHLLAQGEVEPPIDEAVIARIDVARLLDQLPQGQRRAIRATKLLGMNMVEASDACAQSVSLVKVNVHRGLRRMQAGIERQAST